MRRHYIRLFIFSIISLLFFSCSDKSEVSEKKSDEFSFWNPALPVETRINDLLIRMTLDEKISQLTMNPLLLKGLIYLHMMVE